MIPVIPARLVTTGLILIVAAAALGYAYAQGRSDGAAHERAECLDREAERTAAAERDRTEWRAQIDAWEAERRRLEQEAADAIAEIRVEYLPGKTEIRRQIVERAVYRDCRIDDGMRDILNAALLMVLSASASYIVVPAVLRYAIPEANPAIYLGLSLGLTFPMNMLVGIPLYTAVARVALG